MVIAKRLLRVLIAAKATRETPDDDVNKILVQAIEKGFHRILTNVQTYPGRSRPELRDAIGEDFPPVKREEYANRQCSHVAHAQRVEFRFGPLHVTGDQVAMAHKGFSGNRRTHS